MDTWQGEEHLARHNDAAEAPHTGQATEERMVSYPRWILFFFKENPWLDGKWPTEKLDYVVVFPEQWSCYMRDALMNVRVWDCFLTATLYVVVFLDRKPQVVGSTIYRLFTYPVFFQIHYVFFP